jgi:hypothetical protein
MWTMGMMKIEETAVLVASYRYNFGGTVEKPVSIAVETA